MEGFLLSPAFSFGECSSKYPRGSGRVKQRIMESDYCRFCYCIYYIERLAQRESFRSRMYELRQTTKKGIPMTEELPY